MILLLAATAVLVEFIFYIIIYLLERVLHATGGFLSDDSKPDQLRGGGDRAWDLA